MACYNLIKNRVFLTNSENTVKCKKNKKQVKARRVNRPLPNRDHHLKKQPIRLSKMLKRPRKLLKRLPRLKRKLMLKKRNLPQQTHRTTSWLESSVTWNLIDLKCLLKKEAREFTLA
jgi:hypothetical protein